MKVNFDRNFIFLLKNQINYISKDKPIAAKKFRSDLITNLKKDLQNPFNFKKSIYFDNEFIRDYIFKGYTIVYLINQDEDRVEIFEFIKHMQNL